MDKAIEYVNFIVDRYAYLGVSQDASKDDIEKRIRTLRAENHPDRLGGLGQDLKDKAASNWAKIDKCADVLLDDEVRPLYTAKLEEYRRKKKRVLDYFPHENTIFLFDNENDEHIDVDYLLTGQQLDISRLQKEAASIIGYKPEDVERGKKLHTMDPNDADFAAIYRDALQRKVAYLEYIEKYLWGAAGVHGKKFTTPAVPIIDTALIDEVVTSHIEHVRDEIIPQQVEQRANLLALGYDKKPILLLTHGDSKPTAGTRPPEVEESVKLAQTRFEELTKAIKENTRERAEATEALLELSPLEMLHKGEPNHILVHLMMDDTGKQTLQGATVILSMAVVGEPTGPDTGKIEHTQDFVGKTLDELRALPQTHTAAAVLFNPHLGNPYLDFGRAHIRVMRAFGIDLQLNVNRVRDDGSDADPDGDADGDLQGDAPGTEETAPKEVADTGEPKPDRPERVRETPEGSGDPDPE